MSKESESYRLQMLRELQQKDRGPPPPEVLEAEKVIADYRKEQAHARQAIPRLEAGLPKPNMCPRCWFEYGHESFLYAIPADDPTNFDRWKCGKCHYTEDQRIRP